MSDTQPLNIRVIYTASKRERKQIQKKAAKSAAATAPHSTQQNSNAPTIAVDLSESALTRPASRVVQPGARSVGKKRFVGLGLLNLVAAAALCYGTWWPGDAYVFEVFFFRTPLPIPQQDVDDAAAKLFGIKPVKVDDDAVAPRFVGDTARSIIGISAYGWLTLATIAACAVSMAGGSLMGISRGRVVRVFGVILVIAVVGTLGWGAYETWQEFGRQFPTERVRMGCAGLVAASFALGLTWGGRVRSLNRLAGVSVLLAAAASVAGLYLVSECNAVVPEHATPTFLAIVFLAHSSYGWLLLLVSRWMPRRTVA